MKPAAALPNSGRPPKKALVIGALGQDGTYLTELLLAKGYTIIGTTHRDAAALAGSYPATLRHLDLRSQDAISALIVLFAIEHLIAMFTGKEVVPSWH